MSNAPSQPAHSMNVFNCNAVTPWGVPARHLPDVWKYRSIRKCRAETFSDVCASATLARMTNADIRLKRFPGMAELASALASDVAQTLAKAIAARGGASLIVSGGNTPVKFFEQLRTQ